jgi:Cu2+-exporting ATPase
MMTLISLAITVAFVFSLAVTLGYPGDALWWELATLVTIMLLGHWIEMRSIFQASGALNELARLLPSTADRVQGDRIEEVPLSRLEEGDLVLVRPGAGIPADARIFGGRLVTIFSRFRWRPGSWRGKGYCSHPRSQQSSCRPARSLSRSTLNY